MPLNEQVVGAQRLGAGELHVHVKLGEPDGVVLETHALVLAPDVRLALEPQPLLVVRRLDGGLVRMERTTEPQELAARQRVRL